MTLFEERKHKVEHDYEELVSRRNEKIEGNGIFCRYKNPVLTAQMAPPFWRYDYDPESNPYFMERIGVNAVLNSGAIKWNGKYVLVVRVEGNDRKSFFALAESPNGIDNFRFLDHPITMPESDDPAVNIYDMRLTAHEDDHLPLLPSGPGGVHESPLRETRIPQSYMRNCS